MPVRLAAQADAEQETKLDAGDKALDRELSQLEGRDTSGNKSLNDLKRKIGQDREKSSRRARAQGTSPG